MAIIDTSGLEPIADLLKEIYGDLAKPGVAQVGIALATVIGLLNTCLSPIKFLNEKTELNRQNNLKLLAERFSEISPENIVEAPPEIAVPITEKLIYVSNEELRNLYIELLAKASIKDLNSTAHPSFVNIINNLSPDEASLLKTLNHCNLIVTYSRKMKIENRLELFLKTLADEEDCKNFIYPQNLAAYLQNFEGLGIISIIDDHSAQIENINQIQKYLIQINKKPSNYVEVPRNLALNYRLNLFVTDYGKLFLKAIFTEKEYAKDKFEE